MFWALYCRLCWPGREGIFEVEVRGVEQDLMSSVGQLVFPSAAVEGWITNPYVHSLLDSAGKVMGLPTHNGEILQFGVMTCGVGMVINGGRCPEMFI